MTTNQDEVREEFKAKLGNKLAYIGDSGQKHLDDVADWWLSKFDTLLAKKREAIENMKRMESDYDDEDKRARRDVRPYNEALDDAIKILS